MAEATITLTMAEWIWQEFRALARRRGRKPESLAEEILCDSIQRVIDEDLDAATRRAAQRAKFRIEDTEEIIREHRRKKARGAGNGATQKANARRR